MSGCFFCNVNINGNYNYNYNINNNGNILFTIRFLG